MVLDDAPTYCKVFGCDPDFNPYSGKVNDIKEAAEISEMLFGRTFRTCSGHVSIGWHNLGVDEFTKRIAQDVARRFGDNTIHSSYDYDDYDRKKLYGTLGAYRPKPFGVELRQPSNLWLTCNPEAKVFYLLRYDLSKTFSAVSEN
jgi:hypothetical protein